MLAYSRLTHINLSNNNITQIIIPEPYTVRYIDLYDSNNQMIILLENNPLNCDCKMFDFVHFLHTGITYKMFSEAPSMDFVDGPRLTCIQPHSLQLIPFYNLPERSLTCDIADNENYHCPSHCTCTYRPADLANVIDCSDKGLDQIPPSLPVYWEADHTELLMSDNRLVKVQITTDSALQNVTLLNLSNTHLTTLFISKRKQLKVLDLSHNQLTGLDDVTISVLETLVTISLHHNPWKCDCDSLNLLHMITENKVNILGEVTCADGKLLTKLIRGSDICPGVGLFIAIVGCVLLSFSTVATLLYLICYKHKNRILIYCYSSQWRFLRWFVSHPDDLDDDKRYDAFISFANEDFEFVADILVPHLEENGLRKYKLCLHYRDWVVGGYILNQIHKSIKRSKRTLIVMSPAFLQSVWGEAEFRTAYTEEMREGRLRLIVIMYKDIGTPDGLPEELKDYIETKTYLKWEDTPTFWKRLYYVLPHPPDDSDRLNVNCFSFLQNSHQPTRQQDCTELQPVQQ